MLFFFHPCYSQTGTDSLLNSPKSSRIIDSLHFDNDTIHHPYILKKIDADKKTAVPTDSSNNSSDSSTNKQIIPRTITIINNDLPVLKKTTLLQQKISMLNAKDSASSDSTYKKVIQSKSTTFLKKQLVSMVPKGNVSFGYEYGVLPLVASGNYPTGGFKTEGKISFALLNMPLELTYYYTSLKNVVGLTNYFRLSYDASRYKEMVSRKINVKNELNQLQLKDLQLQQQQLLQKIEYLNTLQQSASNELSKLDSLKKKTVSLVDKDKINDSLSLPKIDTSGLFPAFKTTNLLRKLPPASVKNDGLRNKYDYSKQKVDSITNELNKYKADYYKVKNEIVKVQRKIDQAKNVQNNSNTLTDIRLSKIQQFVSHIKKFEIGLCNPSYSTFLINNTPLKGVNIEYAQNNSFFAFTYGTTVSNLMYNPNTIQGAIQGAKNLFNYFDYGNTAVGRKIISAKGGIGSKEGSHFFVGILIGRGNSDYLQPITDVSSSPFTKQCNAVMEFDAKYKFSKQLSLDVILGKSSVQDEDLTIEQLGKAMNQMLSNYRSYALLSKINYDVKKTSTKLSFTTRWVDPYFNSFGIGFIRSDNLQYEIKAEQPITSKIKYSVSYKHQEDNLLQLLSYKNTFNSINNSLNIKFTKQLSVRLNYNPLIQELTSPSSIVKNNNQISTGILSFNPKLKNVTAQFSILFSKYIITNDSNKINIENFTYSQQFQFKSGFKTGANLTWFKNSLKDTVNNNTYLAVVDVGYTTKENNSFTVGGKMAYSSTIRPQYGFVAKATIQLYKGLFWETSAEKIVIGDYYSTFILAKINKFPYYCNTKLIFNF